MVNHGGWPAKIVRGEHSLDKPRLWRETASCLECGFFGGFFDCFYDGSDSVGFWECDFLEFVIVG